ncbi:transcription factor HES-2 [Leptinotarsa decemlineata]|uniref:Putative transcription factor HES-2b-like protein n=1 Tax=Leptinotarsa decemlineata TaxID=7539 RepID=A0A0K0PQL3_LEPDE|nr:transcription factor HES-2-like [Leptinotarsa decemlineata]AKQ48964.1 putative transcription factor HES-2b-like protein [Leptinotarsa decemlineata]
MKTEVRKVQVVSETRKIRKPLMEKKRRARINDSLETLKQILLNSKTTLKDCSKSGQRTAKLEKADILEMTVRYLQQLHGKIGENTPSANKKETIAIRPADSSCENVRMGFTLLPTKLQSGEVVYFIPKNIPVVSSSVGDNCEKNRENVWRPW